MPRRSSVGWFGCSRIESRPGNPIVLRKRVTTRHFAADRDQVLQPHQLADRGDHLGRQPGRSAVSALRFAPPSSNSRNSPTVSAATGANAAASWVSMISRVTSSAS